MKPTTLASAILAHPIEELAPPPQGGGFTSYDAISGQAVAIGVPLGPESADLAIRCHEYGHLLLREVQNSLLTIHDIPDMVKQAVMDVQTNAWLLRKGVPAVSHLPLASQGRVRDETVNLADRIFVAYRSYGLAEPPPVRLARPLRKRVKVAQRMAVRATDPAALLSACHELLAILNAPDPEPEPEPTPGRAPGRGDIPGGTHRGKDTDPEEGEGEDTDSATEPEPGRGTSVHIAPSPELLKVLERLRQREQERAKKEAKERAKVSGLETVTVRVQYPLKGQELDYANPKFMTMAIARPALKRRLQQARDYGRSVRPTYAGGPLRYPTRALPGVGDGRVFGGVAPGTHGSLLIDYSGSMQLSREDIVAILSACPRMRIATYCGNASLNHGELRILADHGRIADEVRHYGDANGVDGPALEWLAKQPGPRIWVCDGHVTGLGDHGSAVLSARCDAIKRAHSIRQYFTLKAFLASRKQR